MGTKADTKVENMVDTKVDTKADIKVENMVDTKVDTKADIKVENRWLIKVKVDIAEVAVERVTLEDTEEAIKSS